MTDANIPDLSTDAQARLLMVQDKFRLDLSDEKADLYIRALIDESITALFPQVRSVPCLAVPFSCLAVVVRAFVRGNFAQQQLFRIRCLSCLASGSACAVVRENPQVGHVLEVEAPCFLLAGPTKARAVRIRSRHRNPLFAGFSSFSCALPFLHGGVCILRGSLPTAGARNDFIRAARAERVSLWRTRLGPQRWPAAGCVFAVAGWVGLEFGIFRVGDGAACCSPCRAEIFGWCCARVAFHQQSRPFARHDNRSNSSRSGRQAARVSVESLRTQTRRVSAQTVRSQKDSSPVSGCRIRACPSR